MWALGGIGTVVLILVAAGVDYAFEIRRRNRRRSERFAQKIYLGYELLKMLAGVIIATPVIAVLIYCAVVLKIELCGKIAFFLMLASVLWTMVVGATYQIKMAIGECPKCSARMKIYVGDVNKDCECDRCGHVWSAPKTAASERRKLPKKIDLSGLD